MKSMYKLEYFVKRYGNSSECFQECVRWDVHVNFWTGQGCKTLFSNSSHTICSFDYISTYALIQTLDVPDDLAILPIVIISITNCCVAAIILTLAVLCWRRVQVGFASALL